MSHRIVAAAPAFLAAALLFPGPAAATHPPLEPTLGVYMTDEHSTVKKSTFGWNEQPFAFLQFDTADINTNKPLEIAWRWKFENTQVSKEFETITNFDHNPLNLWNSLDNWDLHKEIGNWTVKAAWKNKGRNGGQDHVHFTVTTEPLAAILFPFGGLALAGLTRRRKREAL